MKKIVVFIMFLVVAGCCWRSPDSTFYVMNSDNLSMVARRKINVVVARVEVPDMLNKPQMVVYETGGKVKIMEFNRWPEALPDVLQSTITNDLMAYLPNAYVRRSYFDSTGAAYSVNVEINQLEAYVGDKVVLSAWWNIQNPNGVVVKKQQSVYESKVKGKEIEDLVKAQATVVHQLSRDIAVALSKM